MQRLRTRLPRKKACGECQVGGQDIAQWLVREGWALNFEPYAKGRFTVLQNQARANRRGLWKWCFSTPQDFRRWNKRTANRLGAACTFVDDKKSRDILFPDHLNMPPGCPIKGKLSSRALPYVGIYQSQGCASYQRLSRQTAGSLRVRRSGCGLPQSVDVSIAIKWICSARQRPKGARRRSGH